MAENFGNILGQFAISNNPTLMSQKRPGLAGLIGDMISKGKDDPSKQALAQYAPTTLNNPNPMDIIGGALGKAAMPQAKSRFSLAPELQAPDVDLSNLGNFGDVNSTAHASEMGQKADAGKPGFWDSKGGNILGSLLGIIGLGTLGAGIGAISGGGRGALRGASYGMGFGALQDISLRKQSMEAPANLMKLETEQQKALQSSLPSSYEEYQIAQKDPSYGQFLQGRKESPYKSAYLDLATKRDARAEEQYQQGLKTKAVDAQDDIDNLSKIEHGIGNIYSTMTKVPYQQRAAWIIPGASHVSEEAAAFNQGNSLILSNFSRFTGEKGVLTDQDILRVKGALFHPLDAPKVVERKKKELDEVFALAKKRLADKKATLGGTSSAAPNSSSAPSPAAPSKNGGYAPYSRPVSEMTPEERAAEIAELKSQGF